MRRQRLALAVPVATGLLYLLTLSRNYSADSFLYAIFVESGDLALLFDPYHLLLHPLGWLFYRAWRLAGWTGGALLPLQVLNALGGAAAVGLLFVVCRRITGSTRLAGLTTAGFAISGATWLLSVEAEFVTIPVAAQLLVLWGLVATSPERAAQPTYALLLGLGITLATFAYLSGLFLVPIAVASFLLWPGLPRPVRRRQAAILAATVLATWLPAFVALLAVSAGGSWTEIRLLLSSGGAYGQLAWRDLPHGAYTFLRSLALYPGLGMNDSTRAFWADASAGGRALFAGYYAAVFVLAVAPLALAAIKRRVLWQTQRHVLLILVAWAALYGAFAVYWVPGDVSFWLPVLAAWWLLAALALAALPASSRRRGALVAGGVAALLLVANGALSIWPRHDLARNHAYHLAASLAGRTAENDLILTPAENLLPMYVVYFAKRDALPLPDEGTSDEVAFLNDEIARVHARGGRVFVVGETGSAICPGCDLALAWQAAGETVWELVP